MKKLLRYETFLALFLVLFLGVVALVNPSFMAPATQLALSSHMWELGLLALVMTLIILTGGIDLSVGSTLALSAVVLGLLHEAKAPMPVAVAAALLTGTAAGFLNGAFISALKVHPLIVTLASLAAYRGIAIGISNGRPMSGYPEAFQALGGGTLVGIPIPGLVFIAVFAALVFLMSRTKYGIWVHAVGYNERASLFSGIPVDRLKLLLYTASGFCAGVVAVLYVSRRNTAKADIGDGLELEAITAVVLGGTSIFGGKGGLVGTLLGVLILHELREFLGWQWNRNEINAIVTGALLIALVLINRLVASRKGARNRQA